MSACLRSRRISVRRFSREAGAYAVAIADEASAPAARARPSHPHHRHTGAMVWPAMPPLPPRPATKDAGAPLRSNAVPPHRGGHAAPEPPACGRGAHGQGRCLAARDPDERGQRERRRGASKRPPTPHTLPRHSRPNARRAMAAGAPCPHHPPASTIRHPTGRPPCKAQPPEAMALRRQTHPLAHHPDALSCLAARGRARGD